MFVVFWVEGDLGPFGPRLFCGGGSGGVCVCGGVNLRLIETEPCYWRGFFFIVFQMDSVF